MTTKKFFPVFFLALGLMAAPLSTASAADGADLLHLYETTTNYTAERGRLLADPLLAQTLVGLASHADWRVRLEARALLGWQRSPEQCQQAWLLEPATTLAGSPRFVAPELQTAEFAPVMVERFLHAGEDAMVRSALVELISRSDGEWAPALAAAYEKEQEVGLRLTLLVAMRHAEAAVALPVIERGLGDTNAEVRAQAALIAGWHTGGAALAPAMMKVLSDEQSEVRAMAARSLGWQGVADAWSPLRGLLQDPQADVRLRALRALETIDAQKAAVLPELATLINDNDSRVARLAGKLAGH